MTELLDCPDRVTQLAGLGGQDIEAKGERREVHAVPAGKRGIGLYLLIDPLNKDVGSVD